ncbi:hypothetical protein [Pseudobacteriovorax antillogorgiicola]|uniref:Uncharacterized protein n=1 Tax=Pseudobacteriovorax antillogorgiicola TaxID=1513793 RepID=A0A1Y6CI07_9BACT|nr:hypothetical protein [Pseudobacteriovorax antillogorgiicola]TCS47342.1 hypothetical protein EDD56_121117 [Pseudobacteriovorax antillogorgiicola]SMF63155.1 hypothetical protein SAMN06296036_121117 [Pseudobacteriovorax antillogorgiicola]
MNKTIFPLLLGALSLNSVAVGQALITKSNDSGYTLPEYVRNETCSVFTNRVVITKRYGGFNDKSFVTREVKRLNVSEGIRNILSLSQEEMLNKKPNLLCDAPTTRISMSVNGSDQILFASGGCGSPRLERTGPATQMLVDLVNTYCPKTFDFGANGPDLPAE